MAPMIVNAIIDDDRDWNRSRRPKRILTPVYWCESAEMPIPIRVRDNSYGQLGLGHGIDQDMPMELCLKSVRKISCGMYHTLALDMSSQVYGWGNNEDGELGLGDVIEQYLPVKLDLNHIVKIKCGVAAASFVRFGGKDFIVNFQLKLCRQHIKI